MWPYLACCAAIALAAYDPLAVAGSGAPARDFTVNDPSRGREIPIRVYLPDEAPAPVVLFSHGLGGSREGNAYLGKHWAQRGYASVFLQHPGSDVSVWQGKPRAQAREAMREAASGANLLLRVKDVSAVLDQLERWNKSRGHALAGRLDPARVAMSGHSFGAVTAQAVSGRRGGGTDPRIKAAILFSPSVRGGDPRQAFGAVSIPWLLMTGTRDVGLLNEMDVETRLSVFPALPPGGKYELVLDGAEHWAFSERELPGQSRRNPNHHRAILALTTAFLDAWLRGDAAARTWLDGDGARSVLEPKDRWQRK